MKVCLACGEQFAGSSWTCPACGGSPEDGRFPTFAPGLDDPGFEASWFGELAEVESESFWFRARNRLLLWVLDEYFPDARNLLEIGCGTGFVLAGIREARPHIELTGGDAVAEGLDVARRRLPDAALLQLDGRHLPFDREFDVVGAFDVIEHIEEDEVVLREMYNATKPGGGAIVLVPQHPWLWNPQADAGHKRRYRRRELDAKLTAAGYRVVRRTSFVSLLLPLMAASRLLRRKSGEIEDPVAELRTASRMGRVLERVLDLERLMIAKGASLPAGGSLLMVAMRDG